VENSLALDREDTLKKAEKLLRQGRLDGAIAEYVRVVEDQPRDWNTTNTLGDLYVRASQPDKAVAQYSRIADHFFQEGFYPKAAALYKKILKIAPDHEPSQLNLADISLKQGLLADAKFYLAAVGARRRSRGDRRGADEIVVRLGAVDPADIDARIAAARVLAESGDTPAAAARFRELHGDLQEKGRTVEALNALREAVRLNPQDVEARAILAKGAVAAGDLQAARGYLDRETAGDDPSLLVALADIELRSGELDHAREILPKLLALNRELRHAIVELAWTLSDSMPDASFVCIDAAVDASIAAGEFDDAAAILQEFVTRQPSYIPALLKLVEVCVDGGFETTMYDAQAQLTDAYLSAGQAGEARVIAEDLVAREPWEAAHIERFRRALVMLRVPEPDTVIAERLSGQTPFVATDHFAEMSRADAPDGAPPEPAVIAPAPPPPHVPAPEPKEPAPAATSRADTTVSSTGNQQLPQKPGPRGGVEIDLTSVLGEMQGTGPAPQQPPPKPETLDDVFKGFRREAGQAEGPDQAAQHMKLAQTYLEMGMLEEATNALKTAARSPRQRFEAASMLARLYKEHGDLPHALEWFERAAEAPAPTTDEGWALMYDLGVALEATGETARALAVFLELLADAGEYRDVPDRADRLMRVQTGG
jgi:tetratricopeptide (TPR) repeat protein